MKLDKTTLFKIKLIVTKSILLIICFFANVFISYSQSPTEVLILKTPKVIHPFDEVTVYSAIDGTLNVKDSKSKTYYTTKASKHSIFQAGGAAGTQTVTIADKNGKIKGTTSFVLEANTNIEDGGKIGEMFRLFYNGLFVYDKKGFNQIDWNGKTYRFFVHWVLDNNNTASGMKYFSPYSSDLVDLFRQTQCTNGMIWSFVFPNSTNYHYNEIAYGPLNYFRKDSAVWFARQPNENHVEYNYVNMMYQHWKSSANSEWMKLNLESAARALEYCYTDSVRWSKRFHLLKRPYCIDSWDFQVDDEYTPKSLFNPTMVIVPGKTKYGVFFGDNTGYFEACNQVAEMYDFIGETNKSNVFKQRGKAIMKSLKELSWNGKFFTHFIDEDPTVKRNLGVDEKSQIAQGNMYSINRGLPHEMNVAIIETYLKLKENLPVGSPGEWYAIYPPFEKGFGNHNEKWQYMNGGVAGHAIGELARGAYENGYEKYGSDILNRFLELGRKYNNKIYFAYTGSIPPAPPAPQFKTVDISLNANMDLWDKGNRASIKWMNDSLKGNDMRELPVGLQVFDGIKFNIIDPKVNNRRSVIGVSNSKDFPSQVQVSVKDTSSSIYLLHAVSNVGSGKIAGAITFIYSDGTSFSKYIIGDKDISGWWFPSLNSDHSGVAWTGVNLISNQVGVCWTGIDNPNPKKVIDKLQFSASLEGGVYSILGITLANKTHYVKPHGESFGGPDNWAAANGMNALIEGLAGIKNESLGYENVVLSPRWTSTGVDSVNVTANLAASNGYISYKYKNDPINNIISLFVTGSGKEAKTHVLLSEKVLTIKSVTINNKAIEFTISKVGSSSYVNFTLPLTKVQSVLIRY